MTMNEHMLSQPLWLVMWIGIMVGIHSYCRYPFSVQRLAPSGHGHSHGFKCCLYVSAFSKIWLYAYPWIVPCHFLDTCAHLSMIIIFTSLLFDYVDVIKYVLGDRAIVGG